MNCVGCGKEISKRYVDEICVECRFDPLVVISTTEIKKKYRLTDDDINNADLFSITFNTHGNIGTKYLISEIEELVEKLVKDLPESDKKKLIREKLVKEGII